MYSRRILLCEHVVAVGYKKCLVRAVCCQLSWLLSTAAAYSREFLPVAISCVAALVAPLLLLVVIYIYIGRPSLIRTPNSVTSFGSGPLLLYSAPSPIYPYIKSGYRFWFVCGW